MKTIARLGYASMSITAAAAGIALVGNPACSTTEVNGDGGSSSSSSSGTSGSSSGGGGSSGAGSSSSGAGSSGGSSSSGSVMLEAGSDGALIAPTCSAKVPPPPDGGSFLITDFSTLSTGTVGDSGVQYNTNFGTYPGYFGGTYFFPFGPPAVNGPGQPGVDQVPNADAGTFCSVPFSQNSFLGTVTPSSKSWALSGTVAGYSGAGIYIQSAPNLCVDASAYTGVQFTISGTMGSSGDASPDAGTSQISFKAFEGADTAVSTTAGSVGTCTGTCTPPSFAFTLPATPTTMTVHWTDLTGGSPDPSFGDPAHLSGIEWDLPWPCTGGTPYAVNITIQNVQFITQ